MGKKKETEEGGWSVRKKKQRGRGRGRVRGRDKGVLERFPASLVIIISLPRVSCRVCSIPAPYIRIKSHIKFSLLANNMLRIFLCIAICYLASWGWLLLHRLLAPILHTHLFICISDGPLFACNY